MRGYQTAVFTRARQAAERYATESTRELRERGEQDLAENIAAYQAALRRERREEIEAGLHSGAIRGVWSTNALELGVDIGGLDAVILDGYPGTRMATWQQAGRAGRGDEPNLVILVAGEDQLDQYVMRHPDKFFEGDPERAVANPANEQLLPDHIASAATESWITPEDRHHFDPSFPGIVADLEEQGILERRNGQGGIRWTYAGNGSPQHEMSLRTIDDREIDLLDARRNDVIASLPFGDGLRVHPTIADHLSKTESYADVSASRTGVHILCRGTLPEGVKTIADTLPAHDDFPEAAIEVYDSVRFVAMTGAHVKGAPRKTTEAQAFLDELVDDYATVVESTPDALIEEPAKSQTELAAIDTTDDIQDVFDAVQQTGPGDITLHSPVTEERSDGSKSRDPHWTSSESGTRLAETDSGWIYREGMIGMDALQVVALEEGIITDERSYPSGEQFWEAVDALRDRGAHIPSYDSDAGTETPVVAGAMDAETTDDTPAVDPALEYEAELLRETVKEQRARIDELERTLEDRDATIDEQRERLARLAAELKRLREQLNVNGGDQLDTASAEDASTWKHMKDRLLDRGS